MLDASGASGGGQIRLGGDYQGNNAAIQNASHAFVGESAKLRADATESGDGGRIIVWADKTTQYYGNLSARGGLGGGNGGFAEVSGKDTLIFTGGADLGAPLGRSGDLLLDPLDLFIDNRGGTITSIIDEASDVPDNAVTISPAALAAMTANVKLHARRYMRFSDPVVLTREGQSLTALVDFFAETDPAGTPQNRIDIAADITTNRGDVTIKAPHIANVGTRTITTAGGAITLDTSGLEGPGATIDASGLNLDAGTGAVNIMTAESFIRLDNVTGGSLTANALSFINIDAITTLGGPVALTSQQSSINTGPIMSGGGSVTANADFNISINGITSAGGAVGLTSAQSSINVFGTGINAGSGAVNLSGTSVSTGVIDTTSTVNLTATQGTISSTVNNASGITAHATRPNNATASVNISSTADAPLNATDVGATHTGCFSSFGCPTASVTLSSTGTGGINVGTVTASAQTSINNSLSETVSITASNGPITGMPGAQITAANVTLATGTLSGGGIAGSGGAPLNAGA